jgi:hypothetical protein
VRSANPDTSQQEEKKLMPPNTKQDTYRQIGFAVLGVLILASSVYTDIKCELKFTEGAREGIYLQASQTAEKAITERP